MNSNYSKEIYSILSDATSLSHDTENTKGLAVNIILKQSHIDILKELETDNKTICTDIINSDKKRIDINKLKAEDNVILSFSPAYMKQHVDFGFYFTFNDFIKKNNLKLNVSNYYILEDNIHSFNQNDNKLIEIYKIILQLQNIFRNVSDDNEDISGQQNTYTFFDTKKIKIKSIFTKDDIEKIIDNCPDFGFLVKKLFDDIELEVEKHTKIIFLKKSLELVFKNKELTLSDVLKNFVIIFEEYDAHYRAYINSLEPEQIKYKFEEEHGKFLKDLNSMLSDVHNKIIFIPIAFIFGASQMAEASFQKGTMVMFGMFVFTVFISLFLNTQKKVLSILDKNIKSRKNLYKKEHPGLFVKFEENIEDLEDLTKSIKTRISITLCTNWLLTLCVSIIYYFLYSK